MGHRVVVNCTLTTSWTVTLIIGTLTLIIGTLTLIIGTSTLIIGPRLIFDFSLFGYDDLHSRCILCDFIQKLILLRYYTLWLLLVLGCFYINTLEPALATNPLPVELTYCTMCHNANTGPYKWHTIRLVVPSVSCKSGRQPGYIFKRP